MADPFYGELVGEGGEALPRNLATVAHAASVVAKSGPGRLYSLAAYSANVAAQFILVFDLAALPADGAVADIVFKVATVAYIRERWLPGWAFTRGLVICNSSTEPTKTIGSADCSFSVQYI